jgi:hypothetical protein
MSESHELLPPAQKRRTRIIRQIILWLVVILIFYIILSRVEVEEVLEAFRRMNPARFFPIVIIFVIIWLAFDSYTHYWVFSRFDIKLPYWQVFQARAASTLLAGIGFIYGQGGMAYLISKKSGKPISEVISSLLFLFFNTFHTILVMPALGLIFFHDYLMKHFGGTPEIKTIVILLAVAWPVFFISVVFWSRDWKFWPRTKAKGGIWHAFDKARVRDFAAVIGLRMSITILWIIMLRLAIPAFGIQLPLGVFIAFLPLVQLAGAIPTPGRLGSSEAVWLLLFHNIAPEPVLVAISLAWMQSVNISRGIIGLFFFRHFIKD